MVRLLADPVLIAAVVLALYNNLVNLLPQHLHDQVYVPLNLIAGLLDLARDCDAGAASGQRHFFGRAARGGRPWRCRRHLRGRSAPWMAAPALRLGLRASPGALADQRSDRSCRLPGGAMSASFRNYLKI